jgi:hypothetical protein
MDELDFGADKVKDIGAWALEKAGRLKLNGQITGYSPLSRVVELEGLVTGITGKVALWGALLQVAPEEPRLDAARLERLRARGESQRATVEKLRERAAREAFAGLEANRLDGPAGQPRRRGGGWAAPSRGFP